MSTLTHNTKIALDHDLEDLARAHNALSWTEQYSCLQPAQNSAELIALVQGRTHDNGRFSGNNEALYALLTEARHNPAAGRIVLHAMRPLIETSALKSASHYLSLDDANAAAIAAMWETICNYPLHRQTKTTLANLRGEFLKRLCGRWAHSEIEEAQTTDPTLLTELEDLNTSQPALALELIAQATDAGALTHQQATVLIDIYLDGLSTTQAAKKANITVTTLRQRRSRATRALINWINTTQK